MLAGFFPAMGTTALADTVNLSGTITPINQTITAGSNVDNVTYWFDSDILYPDDPNESHGKPAANSEIYPGGATYVTDNSIVRGQDVTYENNARNVTLSGKVNTAASRYTLQVSGAGLFMMHAEGKRQTESHVFNGTTRFINNKLTLDIPAEVKNTNGEELAALTATIEASALFCVTDRPVTFDGDVLFQGNSAVLTSEQTGDATHQAGLYIKSCVRTAKINVYDTESKSYTRIFPRITINGDLTFDRNSSVLTAQKVNGDQGAYLACSGLADFGSAEFETFQVSGCMTVSDNTAELTASTANSTTVKGGGTLNCTAVGIKTSTVYDLDLGKAGKDALVVKNNTSTLTAGTGWGTTTCGTGISVKAVNGTIHGNVVIQGNRDAVTIKNEKGTRTVADQLGTVTLYCGSLYISGVNSASEGSANDFTLTIKGDFTSTGNTAEVTCDTDGYQSQHMSSPAGAGKLILQTGGIQWSRQKIRFEGKVKLGNNTVTVNGQKVTGGRHYNGDLLKPYDFTNQTYTDGTNTCNWPNVNVYCMQNSGCAVIANTVTLQDDSGAWVNVTSSTDNCGYAMVWDLTAGPSGTYGRFENFQYVYNYNACLGRGTPIKELSEGPSATASLENRKMGDDGICAGTGSFTTMGVYYSGYQALKVSGTDQEGASYVIATGDFSEEYMENKDLFYLTLEEPTYQTSIIDEEGNINSGRWCWIDMNKNEISTAKITVNGPAVEYNGKLYKLYVDNNGTPDITTDDSLILCILKTPTAADFSFTSTATYNTETLSAAVTGKDGMGVITVNYYDSNSSLVTNPTNIGTYTVKVDLTEGTAYRSATDLVLGTFTIEPADINNAAVVELAKQTYTGTAFTPKPSGTFCGKALVEDTDYTLTYQNNTNAGTATVTMTGKGNYAGTKAVSFTIEPADINNAAVAEVASQVYAAKSLTPTPAGTFRGMTLVEGRDYTLIYRNNTDAGTATIAMVGKGNYTNTKTVPFLIKPANLSSVTVAELANQTYTGTAFTPKPKGTFYGRTLIEGSDYTLTYQDNTNAGTATVTMTGKGNYTGTKEAAFPIEPADMSSVAVAEIAKQTYTGKALTPKPAGTYCGKTLVEGTDYTLTYQDNINAGTATVTMTGKGNYAGTKTVTFTIEPADMSGVAVAEIANQTYTGTAFTMKPVGTYCDMVLSEDTDYTLTYQDNINAGTATITMTGKGNYAGTKTVTFSIKPADMSHVTVAKIVDQTYTGKVLTPAPRVTFNGKTLTKGTDYTISYADNIKVGTAALTLTGKGNFTGSTTPTFAIVSADLDEDDLDLSVDRRGNVVVEYGSTTLIEGVDYEIDYTKDDDGNLIEADIVFIGGYSATDDITYRVSDDDTETAPEKPSDPKQDESKAEEKPAQETKPAEEPEPEEPQSDESTGLLNENPIVVVSTQKMTVSDKAVTPAAYNCDGYNYFKIRDLCDLLTKAGYPVNVTYSDALGIVAITTGEAYVAIGGEQTPVGTPSKVVVSSQTFLLDGKRVSFDTYNIDGYNYVNLRQFCAALGITVSYDEATQTMQVVTGTPFEAEKSAEETKPAEAQQSAEEPQSDVPTGPLSETPTVVVSTQKMTIYGKVVTPAAYNCDGYNYFKIRDLCDLFTKAGYPMNVTYNEALRVVVITTGEAYVAIGGEQTPVGTPDKVVVSGQTFLLDGKQISFDTYNIDGYNYVNLRQFCAALGITVSYDEATRTMQIVDK